MNNLKGDRNAIFQPSKATSKENGVLYCAQSMVAFLQCQGLLNEEKVMDYLKTVEDPKEHASGLQKF